MSLLKGCIGSSLDRDVASTPYGINVMMISSGYGNVKSSRMCILSLARQSHHYID
jgi:hypothetical protein